MPSTSSTKHSSASPSPTSGLFTPDTNTKSSAKTTTIIVAVLAVVGGIVLAIFLVRSFRHWRQKRAIVVPLPPVQPIAHHREHQLAQFEERKFNPSAPPSPNSRPGSWAMHQLSAPDRVGSDASLIPSEHHHRTQSNNNNSGTPSPNVSLLNQPALSLADENPLPHPAPAFHGTGNPRDSNSSFGSIPERSSSTPSPLPFPDTPPPSSQSHTSSTHPLISSNSTSSSRPMRPRPTSMISNASRASRKSMAGTATTTIRGAPHGPHSNVQIVLPTPLAPGLSPYGRGEDGEWLYGDGVGRDIREGSGRSDSRLSMADKWAGVPIGRSERDERERGRNDFGRIYGNADPRDSIGTARTLSTISSTHAPSPSQTFFRSLPPSSFRDHSRTPPPHLQNTRIPSAYNTNPNQLDEATGKEGMGRPTSLSIDQTRPYSRSDSNSISLSGTRN